MRFLVNLSIYLLAGTVWHIWLYGPVQWDAVMSWGVIVFWPLVIAWIVVKWLVLAVLVILAAAFAIAIYEHFASAFKIWRLRREIGRKLKSNRESNVE